MAFVSLSLSLSLCVCVCVCVCVCACSHTDTLSLCVFSRSLARSPPSRRLSWRTHKKQKIPLRVLIHDVCMRACACACACVCTCSHARTSSRSLSLTLTLALSRAHSHTRSRSRFCSLSRSPLTRPQALLAITGMRTVPNIFLAGESIGGCSELKVTPPPPHFLLNPKPGTLNPVP